MPNLNLSLNELKELANLEVLKDIKACLRRN